jgi:hypothetical protein
VVGTRKPTRTRFPGAWANGTRDHASAIAAASSSLLRAFKLSLPYVVCLISFESG